VKKILLWAAGFFLLLLLAVGGFLWWVTSTEAGARRAVSWLGAALKGSLQVEKVEGPIRGPLILHGVSWKTESLTVTVERIRLDWVLGRLLRRQLDITSLGAEGVRIVPVGSETEKPREALPDVHLPVNIIVRDAGVRDIELASGEGPPFRIDSLELATRAVADTVRVERLGLQGPTFRALAEGTVRPQGDYPVDLRIAWRLALEGSPAYEGRLALSGTLESLSVRQELTAPFPARLEARLTTPLRDLRFDGQIAFSRLRTRQLSAEAPEAALAGSVRAKGSLERFVASGQISADVATNRLGRVDAVFDVERREENYKVKQLSLTFPGRPAVLTASGTVQLASKQLPRFDLALGWQKLAWPLSGVALVRSPRGEARVAGLLDDYHLSLDAQVEGPRLPQGRWRLEGQGGREAMRLSSFHGSLLRGTIAGSARFSWKPAVTWQVTASGEGLDPGVAFADYPGRLAFDAQSQGRLTPRGAVGRVAVERLDGTLRGQPVEASVLVDLNGKTIFLRRSKATVAAASLSASGRIGETSDLQWQIEVPNLAAVFPESGGSLSGSGRLRGRREAPRVEATARGRSLLWGGRRLASLELEADVNLSPQARSSLRLEASGARFTEGGRLIDTIRFSGNGTRSGHNLTLEARSGEDRFALAAKGGLAGNTWRGTLDRLDLASREAGNWALARPAPVTASNKSATLADFCWISGSSRLCASGAWRQGGTSTLEASLSALPLTLFSPWLAAAGKVTGSLDGRINARIGAQGAVLADIDLAAGPGEIRYEASEGVPASVAYREASLRVRAEEAGASAAFSAQIAAAGSITGALELPRYSARGAPEKAQPLSGRLEIRLPDLAFVGAFVPIAERVGGKLEADWRIAGTLGEPTVSGQASLSEGRAELPDWGLKLRELSVSARGDGSRQVTLEASVRSGEGRLTLQGRAPLSPSTASPATLRLKGRRFLALGMPDRRVLVEPDLAVTFDGRAVGVNGDVTVPEAKIEYESKFAAIPVSPDVVLVGRADENARRKAPLPIQARVRLILGDRVELQGLGFDGRLEGSLLLLESPGRRTSGAGELVIQEGTYKAYGQDLRIERGRLVFAGPIDNPGVDLRAYRKADDGTIAGVVVKGTLRNPETTLYSVPPMAQADALAYLLLGHPLNQASSSEGNLVANAANSLGIKGGNLLGKQIAARFGLETARVETEGSLEQASLMVGKYLSPRFYLEYGIGLFDQASRLRIRYILSRKWTLRAETGAANAADILYTIER
jgi:translocation and assembly module TamB